MLGLPVSVLDFGIAQEGTPTGQAIADVLATARHADRLGFRRFWVAEHHGSQRVSGGFPPVMVGRLAAETRSIRVGAGGVMLPNHSAVAVAEQFGTLGALDPGRIDLGIGRGPGSFDPGYLNALRLGAGLLSELDYADRLRELLGYLRPDRAAGVRVWLAEEHPPELWLLASSPSSALLAAEQGLPLSFAYHNKPENAAESVALYRDRFKASPWQDRPRVMLSAAVTCAGSDELAAGMAWSTQRLLTRSAATQGTRLGQEDVKGRPSLFAGSVQGAPETVTGELAELVRRFAPDELILVPVHAQVTDRIRCLELLSHPLTTGPAHLLPRWCRCPTPARRSSRGVRGRRSPAFPRRPRPCRWWRSYTVPSRPRTAPGSRRSAWPACSRRRTR